jgi:hypothetical protein
MNFKNISIVTALAITMAMTGCSDDADFSSLDALTGSVGKGKAIQATVSAYKDDNTLLGTDSNLVDGIYSIPLNGYTGKVRVEAKITEYIDEKLNQSVTVDNLELSAVSCVSPDNKIINVTPLTEASARILGEKALVDANVTQQDIADMNIYVAKAAGVTNGYNPAKDAVVYLHQDAGEQADTPSNRNAIVLLSISKESALEADDNSTEVLNNANTAIDSFYSALLKSSTDKTELESIVEDLNSTGVSIKGVLNTDIIINEVDAPDKYDEVIVAIQKIAAYATDSGANPAPTVADYAAAGVTGVDADSLNAVNARVDATNAAGVDTVAKIQTIIDVINGDGPCACPDFDLYN